MLIRLVHRSGECLRLQESFSLQATRLMDRSRIAVARVPTAGGRCRTVQDHRRTAVEPAGHRQIVAAPASSR